MDMRCLLVDDDARFLKVARALLERQGIAVVGVATTSAEALHRTEELRPDVLLLDINLGSESGFELARRVDEGAVADGGRPEIIFISGHAQEDFEDLIEASPAVGFLDKTELSATAIRDLLRPSSGCTNGRL